MCSPCNQPEGAHHGCQPPIKSACPQAREYPGPLGRREGRAPQFKGTITTVGRRQDLVREGDRPSECCLVLEGFAYRYKLTQEGKRQIFSFHIPGDIPDLQSLHIDVMDHSLSSLCATKALFIPHETVRDLTRRCPRIGDAFWRDTLIDAAVFREWMVCLGRREAYGHMAHLLCELYVRLKSVGLTNGDGYAFPADPS